MAAGTPRVVVIGVGNAYRRDDGLGPAVLDRLAGGDPLPGVRLVAETGETSRLIDAWCGADLAIVVDAVRAEPARPGRIHRFTVPGRAPDGRQDGAASSHGLGLGEAVELAGLLDRLPARLVFFAVEVAEVGFGAGLSARVSAAAGEVAARIRGELAAVGAGVG